MNKALGDTDTQSRTHLLQSTPETVHWGYFDGALEPVLTVDSGDRVVIECVSGGPGWMPPPSSGFKVLPDLKLIHEKVKQGTGNHILTGPIAVRGAAIGDVLEVKIVAIALRQDWGFNLFRAYGGTLPEDFPYYRLIHVALDKATNMATLPSGLQVPMRPFFGQLATAPTKSFGRQNSKEPREFGGNIDCKELTAGSTIYLPVWNEGALFSTGDGHAAQGDGEVNGTAIEASLTGTFQFIVHKGSGRGMKWPRAEDATHYYSMGLDLDLDRAMREATQQTVDFLREKKGLSTADAYALASIAVDFRVAEAVDAVQMIYGAIPKKIFKQNPEYWKR